MENNTLHSSPIDSSDSIIREESKVNMEDLYDTLTYDEKDHIIMDIINGRNISPYDVELLVNINDDKIIFILHMKNDEDNIVGTKVVTDLDDYILELYNKFADLKYNVE
jgi:hypothetical protein